MMNFDSIFRNIGIILIGLSACIWSIGQVSLKPQTSIEKVSNEASHDFQLVQLGEWRRDQFLLDKKTGRIWRHACEKLSRDPVEKSFADCNGILIWEEMYVSDWTDPNSRIALYYQYLMKQEQAEKEKNK